MADGDISLHDWEPLNGGQSGTNEQNDAFAGINALLGDYGLGTLGDWAWGQIVNGSSKEQIVQSLRQRPEYQARFPAMAIRRAKGLAPISEGDYINSERTTTQLMRQAGMPSGFYDTPDDFTTLIGNDVSAGELSQRILNGYQRVATAAPEVRNAFRDYFGQDGDTALAAYFLDPDKAAPFLDKAATEAEIGGTAGRFGVGIQETMARRLADAGINAGSAQQGFTQVAQLDPLFRETVTEGQDLTAADTGVGAVFGLDAGSASAVKKRRDARAAEFGGTSTQAAQTNQGQVGLGSANQN